MEVEQKYKQNFDSKYYVTTTPRGAPKPDVYVLHNYKKNHEDQDFWKIQYKKAKGIKSIDVNDLTIVLGAWVSNYLVRVSLEDQSPSLLAPKKMMHIVWNGVDIKAVYGQDHFEVPTVERTLEELRQIGLEAQKKLEAWVSNGGPLMGTAKETREVLQK